MTGTSDGIGRAFAGRLAAAGFDLVLEARREADLVELAGALRAQHAIDVEVIAADLSDGDQVRRVADATAGHDIGLLVAAAGLGTSGRSSTAISRPSWAWSTSTAARRRVALRASAGPGPASVGAARRGAPERIAAPLDCEIAKGRLLGDAGHWSIEVSTLPWREETVAFAPGRSRVEGDVPTVETPVGDVRWTAADSTLPALELSRLFSPDPP